MQHLRFTSFLSESLQRHLLNQATQIPEVPGLMIVGGIDKAFSHLETPEALNFVCQLYDVISPQLEKILEQRELDRQFIDSKTVELKQHNKAVAYHAEAYKTVIGLADHNGHIPIGPLSPHYQVAQGDPVAPIPAYLQGSHITLFGPPDTVKMSINAMNAWHRAIPNEPAIINELLLQSDNLLPKWGADSEDSKTPLKKSLLLALDNLIGCFRKDLSYADPVSSKTYQLADHHLSQPIKRFPGIALPSTTHFLNGLPIPLHVYDFALHLFHLWQHPEALAFYVPKLETEEEAAYIKIMIETAEKMLKAKHPEYKIGTVKIFVVLENPRLIFRLNEAIDNLHPYFAGASLGWHDYLASTARLFKHDPNYTIPVKADPDIVVKHIHESHQLLSNIVGPRGGIKIGGMYGVLPRPNDALSFEDTMVGFIRDVVIQLKRELDGFWVAHPDFVRIGIALVVAWKAKLKNKNDDQLEKLIQSLVVSKENQTKLIGLISSEDAGRLNAEDPHSYQRDLIAAKINQSDVIANNDPEEIRYNVFQALQYLADWLAGNGCVALPASTRSGAVVRVMDDLATTERSRWEVWSEIHHGRFKLEDFLRIAHEELQFIRTDIKRANKEVAVTWDERTEKWYPIAFKLLIKLMTDKTPVEFVTEYLMGFTIESVRAAADPWAVISEIDPDKYAIDDDIERFNLFFDCCGCQRFASEMVRKVSVSLPDAQAFSKAIIDTFSKAEIIEAASFHGTIGEAKKNLDKNAVKEQSEVQKSEESLRLELLELGQQYGKKFGIKFLICATGKSAEFIRSELQRRLNNTLEEEIANAKKALSEITDIRISKICASHFSSFSLKAIQPQLETLLEKYQVSGVSLALTVDNGAKVAICAGVADKSSDANVMPNTFFEAASLSKTIAAAFALEYFKNKNISLDKPVNELFAEMGVSYRIRSAAGKPAEWAQQLTIRHLMNHTGLGMHYVMGIPLDQDMPDVLDLIEGKNKYGYQHLFVEKEPGKTFSYSGGGFLVLQYLLESIEKKPINALFQPFFKRAGMDEFTFDQHNEERFSYACGYRVDGREIDNTRLMFPALAAGGLGSPRALVNFLNHLIKAYNHLDGSGPISHDTAVQMLHGVDLGSQAFMGANMGVGVFTIEAGPNQIAIHQAANDGFRGVFLACFKGPDAGKSIVLLNNGDNNATFMNAEILQILLQHFNWQGIDFSRFKRESSIENVAQEQIVNNAYLNMVFSAFNKDLPELPKTRGAQDPHAQFNLAVGATILSVSNQQFGRADNLISPTLPVFDPNEYGRHGKVMDSWETVRHNSRDCDELVLQLSHPSDIHYVGISTKYHDGNHAEAVKIEGYDENNEWQTLVEKSPLEGHSLHRFAVPEQLKNFVFSRIRVSNYPDGGISRLYLYNQNVLRDEQLGRFVDSIPKATNSVQSIVQVTPQLVNQTWEAVDIGDTIDLADRCFGTTIKAQSNEHYGSAQNILLPGKPKGMHDGFETKRSREKDHQDYVIIKLGKPAKLDKIVVDFTYFVHNNPNMLAIQAYDGRDWITLVNKTSVKAYAGNQIEFHITHPALFQELKVMSFPDGGFNRLHVYTKVTHEHKYSYSRQKEKEMSYA